MKRGPHSSPETHPDTGALLDWLEGRTGSSAATSVRSHVATCAVCRLEVEGWRTLLSRLGDESDSQPPADLVQWALNIPARLAPAGGRKTILTLISDSWDVIRESVAALAHLPVRPAMAVRSLNGSLPRLGRRRILYSTAAFDLDLEIDYSGPLDPRRVHGQILPNEEIRGLWIGSEVRLVTEGRTLVRARTDRRGEFEMPRVRPGRYSIQVEGPLLCDSPSLEV